MRAKVGDSIVWEEHFDDVQIDLHGIVVKVVSLSFPNRTTKYFVKHGDKEDLWEISEDRIKKIEG
jgi:hypothetical protein